MSHIPANVPIVEPKRKPEAVLSRSSNSSNNCFVVPLIHHRLLIILDETNIRKIDTMIFYDF